jgi:prepilin-type N-terminal cleavage/methylation domain-containing protein
MRMMRKRRSQAGFTTVELLAVVAIVGILAVIAITSYLKWTNWAKTAETRDLVVHIAAGQVQYNADTDGYLSCSANYNDFYPMAPSKSKRLFRNSSLVAMSSCYDLFHVDADSATYSGFVVLAGNPGTAIAQPPTVKQISFVADPGKPWFVVYAATNLDGDSEYERMYTTSFAPGEVHIENQGE